MRRPATGLAAWTAGRLTGGGREEVVERMSEVEACAVVSYGSSSNDAAADLEM